MNENMETKDILTTKWLRGLMYTTIASLVNGVLNVFPFVPTALTTWISRGILLAVFICLFKLGTVNARYQKAAICRGIMLACTLIIAFLFASPLLSLVSSIASIVAVYQEYTAHSELLEQMDPKLSGKWHSLFLWGIAAGLLVSIGSVIATMILVMQELDAVGNTAVVIGLLSIPQFIIDVIYLLYLKRMVAIFDRNATLQ